MNATTAFCIDSFEVKYVNRSKRLLGLISALGLLILILDGKTALAGARDGIELCLKSVIPALFPFFVLSSAVIQNALPGGPFSTRLCSLFRLPRIMASFIAPCFLGGYPVGAQSVCYACERGYLTKPDAEKLLAFSNNAGPSFLFGIVAQMFPKRWMVWALWGIHIAGALAAAQCVAVPDSGPKVNHLAVGPSGNLMSKSVVTMGIVCGWIILFRVAIAFLDRWFLWLLPQTIRIVLIGLLELSNGCCELARISNLPIRFLLCSGMLAAGGLCVTSQTVSVTHGLSLDYYWLGKLVQIAVSLTLSASLMYRSILPLVLLLPILIKCKKRDGNRIVSGV